MKAESWARDKGLPFPKIEGNPLTEDRNLRECYVFEDPDDVNCPTVLHFPLVNIKFKDFLIPGISSISCSVWGGEREYSSKNLDC